MMINARIAQIDHLLSIQLNEIMHHPAFQKLEGSWRGLKYLMDNSETGVGLKIRVLNVIEEGAAARHRKGPRVRPERALQEDLRGRVRRLRRRSVRRADRRLRVRQASGRYGAAGRHLAHRRPGPCALRQRGGSRPVQPGELHLSRCAARPGQDLRLAPSTPSGNRSARARIRATSRLTLPAHAGPPALRRRNQAGRRVPLRRARRRHRSLQVPVEERGLRAGHPDDAVATRCMACAWPSAASKAADWWKVCRPTPSTPTKATWR